MDRSRGACLFVGRVEFAKARNDKYTGETRPTKADSLHLRFSDANGGETAEVELGARGSGEATKLEASLSGREVGEGKAREDGEERGRI